MQKCYALKKPRGSERMTCAKNMTIKENNIPNMSNILICKPNIKYKRVENCMRIMYYF